MALAIITADQRRQSATVKGQIWGQAGMGKTSLLKTLDPASTLCLDFEAGLLSVQRDDARGPAWSGDSIKVENWLEARAILEAFQARQAFLARYRTVFIDSTTFASKQCMAWCQAQPAALTDKGKEDIWAIYRLLSEEMVGWVQGWKYLEGVHVWLVGGLERKKLDGVNEWIPLLDGMKLYAELPYIMDYCFVMGRYRAADGETYAGLFTDGVAHPEYAYVPLKSRVAGLAAIEAPDLSALTAKALAPTKPHSSTPTSEVKAS
jgi:hypothetical protein